MNWKIPSLFYLLLGLLSVSTIDAQTPPMRTNIPVGTENTALKITGIKDPKIENLEGGGIRISFRNDKDKRSSLQLEYHFPQPIKATSMGFEFRQAETEKLTASGLFENGKRLKKMLESMGPEIFPYAVDFSQLATGAKMDLDSPLKSVTISFRISPQSGDRFVELKSWWVE